LKSVATSQKLRGGYYTPPAICEFLVRWAVRRRTDRLLEPSCGDGAFIDAVLRRRQELPETPDEGSLIGIELDKHEAAKAKTRLENTSRAEVHNTDFFRYCRDTLLPEGLWEALAPRFDAVVGNPPFIRYQNFPDAHRQLAFTLMERFGMHPNKLTNAWVPFLICSALALGEDGRLAMVIPAELLQVNYAAEIRRFLSEYFARITIITFRSLVFPDIQQEVVLLLADRAATESRGIRTVELTSASDLESFDYFESLNAQLKELDHSKEKWTKYFLPATQISLLRVLRASPDISRLSEFAEVDVGVVTGENDFFLIKPSDATTLGVSRITKRAVSRSAHLLGLHLTESDWQDLRNNNARVLLFYPRHKDITKLSQNVQRYIKIGEERGYHTGYKCRIRKPWYIVPSVWVPDAFALRQVHRFPKLVLNRAKATVTDTVHRVRFRSGIKSQRVCGAFLNSLTFAFAEIMGRSYGGGVLTFEPREVEGLPIPVAGSNKLDLRFIDAQLRAGKIYAVLDHTDQILLRDHLGLDDRDVGHLRSAWERLRDRRTTRRSQTKQLTLESGAQAATPVESDDTDSSRRCPPAIPRSGGPLLAESVASLANPRLEQTSP